MHSITVRITVFAFDKPQPPTSGGRLDIASQLKAFSAANIKTQLFYYDDGKEYPNDSALISDLGVSECHKLCFRRSLSRSASRAGKVKAFLDKLLAPMPPCASDTCLFPNRAFQSAHLIGGFKPDAVLVHGVQCVGVWSQLRPLLGPIPWIYRSHNNEALYHYMMAKAAKTAFAKCSLLFQAYKLIGFESSVMSDSGATLHISHSEYIEQKQKKVPRQFWVPPIVRASPRTDIVASHDVGILSSWFSSHKQDGIRWFCREVMPLLGGECRVVVAGSGAPEWFANFCAQNGLRFIGPVASPSEFYASSRVLVNPVQCGTGVNMKAMEMLCSGVPVVTTSSGLNGLPAAVHQRFRIAHTAAEMAAHIKHAMNDPRSSPTAEVLSMFDDKAFIERFTQAYQAAREHCLKPRDADQGHRCRATAKRVP